MSHISGPMAQHSESLPELCPRNALSRTRYSFLRPLFSRPTCVMPPTLSAEAEDSRTLGRASSPDRKGLGFGVVLM